MTTRRSILTSFSHTSGGSVYSVSYSLSLSSCAVVIIHFFLCSRFLKKQFFTFVVINGSCCFQKLTIMVQVFWDCLLVMTVYFSK